MKQKLLAFTDISVTVIATAGAVIAPEQYRSDRLGQDQPEPSGQLIHNH